MKRYLTILFTSLSLIASAQEDLNQSSGFALSFGKILSGQIEVSIAENRIMIREGSNISLLHAKDVQKVSIRNDLAPKEQIYYTGTFGMNNILIFEALSDGTIPLLYREGLKFSPYDEQEYPPFYLMKDEQVYSLGASKKEILEVFDGQFEKDLHDFIKKNKVDFKSKEGLTSLFDYYNSITMIASNL